MIDLIHMSTASTMSLNQRALQLCNTIQLRAADYRIAVLRTDEGTTVLDFGVQSQGGLRAGLALARICMADLAAISVTPATTSSHLSMAEIVVATDHPLAACMASQYAGWQVQLGDYFGMGSGPMRAAASREPLLAALQMSESVDAAIGILEASKLPTSEVCRFLADACRVRSDSLTLCVAPTRSIAGTVQVIARCIETAIHKLHELGYPIINIVSGWGSAPLPPPAATDVVGIGRTNDAILYGGQVTLWVNEKHDDIVKKIVEQVPSSASRDYGVPFMEIFQRYNGNFYKIDPHLFSPSKICIANLNTGNAFTAGERRDDILARSFGISSASLAQGS